MRKIIITMSSVTVALKAKKLLESKNISSRLIKIDSMKANSSCTHGIEIDYKNFMDTVSILKSKGISYKTDGSDYK